MNNTSIQLLDRAIYSITAIFLLSLAYSEALKSISIVLMTLLLAYALLTKQCNVTKDLTNGAIVLHALFVVIGIWVGINPDESMEQFSDILKILVVFLFFREINLRFCTSDHMYRYLLIGFILAAAVELYHYDVIYNDFVKLKSVGSVNRTATYSVLIFVLSFGLLRRYIRNLDKHKFIYLYISAIALLVSLTVIILGASRMAMFTLPLIIVTFFIFDKIVSMKNLFFIVLSMTAIWLIIYNILPEARFIERFNQGFDDEMRIQIWLSSFQIWLEHNLFFGIGVGNSISFNTSEFFGKDAIGLYKGAIGVYIDNTHNVYLDMLLERGLLGLSTFLLFMGSLFFNKSNNVTLIRILIFSILVMGLANITFRYEFGLLFVCIAGLSLNKSLISKIN